MSVNKAILVGNLGKDPDLRYTASGTAVASFSIATSERYKDRDGQKQEKTEWHNIVAWRQLAEICGKYLTKGRQVYIEGKIQTRSYEDRDGNKRYTTEIVADEMRMLGRPGEESGGSRGGYAAQGQGGQGFQGDGRPNDGNQGSSNQGNAKQAGGGFEEPPYNADDDIPF